MVPKGVRQPTLACQDINIGIGLPRVYNSRNPFPWMNETIDMAKEQNVGETRVTERPLPTALCENVRADEPAWSGHLISAFSKAFFQMVFAWFSNGHRPCAPFVVHGSWIVGGDRARAGFALGRAPSDRPGAHGIVGPPGVWGSGVWCSGVRVFR